VTTTPEPLHLSSHHRETLSLIFQHPINHNIDWRTVLSLLEAVASVEEQHSGRYLVTIGSETETFERPNGKDIDAQQVMDLRRMLASAGFGPGDDVAATDKEPMGH
jgi:hypothetical protein